MAEKEVDLIFRGTLHLKRAVVRVLREIFADPNIMKDERYRYIPSTEEDANGSKSKVSIYRSFPKRIEKYPAIIVSIGSHDADLVAMGVEREDATESFDNNGVLSGQSYVGHSITPVTVTVISEGSADDRDNLIDYLVMIFRVLGRGKFGTYGFSYNKIAISGDSETTSDSGEILFSNSVTINCNTDYWYKEDFNQAALIESIALKVFGQTSPNSTSIQMHPD